MLQRTLASPIKRPLSSTMLSVMVAALSACGGGGGDSSPATVSSMSVASSKPGAPVYGLPVIVTVNGTHLSNLSLTASGCKNVTRLSAAPNASTDTTAYFSCTPSGAYTSPILAVSNGGTVAQQTLTVPAPIVTMVVSGAVNGNIIFNLKGNVAPLTVDNFLAYVNAGFYDGADGKGATIFHRVADFNDPQSGHFPYSVVQGGGYLATTNATLPPSQTKPATHDSIALETTGGKNVQWTAAMASNSSGAQTQFFFNVADNSSAFDTASTAGYAVFADVSGSAAVITQIAQLLQTPSACPPLVGFSDGSCLPVPNVRITSATQTQ
jgi:cyclophilin family peptidyl-prolyl cis-trans isomerase